MCQISLAKSKFASFANFLSLRVANLLLLVLQLNMRFAPVMCDILVDRLHLTEQF